MKRHLALIVGIVSLGVAQAGATTYNDSVGDLGGGATATILDITSVEVNNTATDLIFKINLSGDPVATDWGKYLIGIDSTAGGDPTGDGWNRPIGMSGGMDYWLGSWADFGNGAETYNWNGSAWNLLNATYGTPGGLSFSKDTSSVTIIYPFASLGLSVGNSFLFDVYTSGGTGTDSAIDALANPGVTVANWGDNYNSGSLVVSYTLIPEPTAAALLGLGSLIFIGRLVRRRN